MKPTTVTGDLYSFILSDELKSDGLRERSLLKSPLAPSQPPWYTPALSGASLRFPPSPGTQAGPVPPGGSLQELGKCRGSGRLAASPVASSSNARHQKGVNSFWNRMGDTPRRGFTSAGCEQSPRFASQQMSAAMHF